VSLELPLLDLTGLSAQVIAALLFPALSIAVVSFTAVMITSRAFARGAMPDASSEMRAVVATQFATGLGGGYPMSASSHLRRWPMRHFARKRNAERWLASEEAPSLGRPDPLKIIGEWLPQWLARQVQLKPTTMVR
jgi:hypothetical protein